MCGKEKQQVVDTEEADELKDKIPAQQTVQDEPVKPQNGKKLFDICPEFEWVHPANFL